MRIRNSRPPFPLPSVSDPTSRFTHRLPSGNGLYFDDRFLVQETNRQIGWSFYHLKHAARQVSEEGPCGELNKAMGGPHEAWANRAHEGSEPYLFIKDNKDGNTSSGAVNFDIAQPFTSYELGGEVSDKKKKQICLLETEMARGRKEDAILEKKMELGNVSEKSIEDEYGSKRTRTLFCPTNCEYFFLPENEGFEGYGMQGGMSFEDMVVETKEKPRRVKKRKEGDQSGDAKWYTERFIGKQASNEGKSSKRGKPTADAQWEKRVLCLFLSHS
ncbi:Saccharopine dehydrogenase protein [Gossypium arboreum]|uniref:Saccharopine dehydrogenase protein n=1 Tax=Gossypium arboreum TaxID=29729 RepID=A0A0B0N4N9_GOSAR|nr:Saccharopine dehydrogenase protein [Gossypium arboreum]